MMGDADDMSRRIKAILPTGWLGDPAPVAAAVLQGIGTGFAECWTLIQSIIEQTRISTANGPFLDMIAADYFGASLFRFPNEPDVSFKARITAEMLRPRATRMALNLALEELTGRTAVIFEPARTSDTGGYSIGGVGYNAGGGWGSLSLPFQFFVTVYRPGGGGIPELGGYSAGGVPVYGSLSMEAQQIPDITIRAAIPPLLPAGTIAWMRISN